MMQMNHLILFETVFGQFQIHGQGVAGQNRSCRQGFRPKQTAT